MKIAYHYTSWQNWEKIQNQGLVPYLVDKPEIRARSGRADLYGIFLYPERLHGLTHCGSVLFQAATKATSEVALIKVEYDPRDTFLDNGNSFELRHNGQIGELKYHDDVPLVLTFKSIPPERVQLVAKYDLAKAF